MDLDEMMDQAAGVDTVKEERQRVVGHLMTSLETWRDSRRIGLADSTHLDPEEKELKHAYDLLQILIAKVQKLGPDSVVELTE